MAEGCWLVDQGTGEIAGEIGSGDRIVRAKSLKLLSETTPAPDAQFVKLFREVVSRVVSECSLTAAEFSVFLFLSSNLRYQSNVAKYSNGQLITKDKVEEELGLSRMTVHRATSGLIKHGLVAEAKTEEGRVFVVNPFVCCVGDRINKTTFDLFRSSKWAKEYKAKTSIHPNEERR